MGRRGLIPDGMAASIAPGGNSAAIARTLGVSQQAVWKFMRKHGIETRPRGCPTGYRGPTSDRTMQILADARDFNLNYREIADRYGVSKQCVQQAIAYHVPELIAERKKSRRARLKAERSAACHWECRDDPWTEEDVEQLKTLRASGASASDIGRAIRRSRNAILGKARRLGFGIIVATVPQ